MLAVRFSDCGLTVAMWEQSSAIVMRSRRAASCNASHVAASKQKLVRRPLIETKRMSKPPLQPETAFSAAVQCADFLRVAFIGSAGWSTVAALRLAVVGAAGITLFEFAARVPSTPCGRSWMIDTIRECRASVCLRESAKRAAGRRQVRSLMCGERFKVEGIGAGSFEGGDGEAKVFQDHCRQVRLHLLAGEVAEGAGDALDTVVGRHDNIIRGPLPAALAEGHYCVGSFAGVHVPPCFLYMVGLSLADIFKLL
jgi:hypothetical protein